MPFAHLIMVDSRTESSLLWMQDECIADADARKTKIEDTAPSKTGTPAELYIHAKDAFLQQEIVCKLKYNMLKTNIDTVQFENGRMAQLNDWADELLHTLLQLHDLCLRFNNAAHDMKSRFSSEADYTMLMQLMILSFKQNVVRSALQLCRGFQTQAKKVGVDFCPERDFMKEIVTFEARNNDIFCGTIMACLCLNLLETRMNLTAANSQLEFKKELDTFLGIITKMNSLCTEIVHENKN